MSKYARRTDSNQQTLVKTLRKIPGVTVAHTHSIGDGFPDVIVGLRVKMSELIRIYGKNGCVPMNYMIEIKDGSREPARQKLTSDESTFHETWTGQVAVISTTQQALQLIGISNERYSQENKSASQKRAAESESQQDWSRQVRRRTFGARR